MLLRTIYIEAERILYYLKFLNKQWASSLSFRWMYSQKLRARGRNLSVQACFPCYRPARWSEQTFFYLKIYSWFLCQVVPVLTCNATPTYSQVGFFGNLFRNVSIRKVTKNLLIFLHLAPPPSSSCGLAFLYRGNQRPFFAYFQVFVNQGGAQEVRVQLPLRSLAPYKSPFSSMASTCKLYSPSSQWWIQQYLKASFTQSEHSSPFLHFAFLQGHAF